MSSPDVKPFKYAQNMHIALTASILYSRCTQNVLMTTKLAVDKKKKQTDFIDIPQNIFYTDHKYDRPATSEHVLIHLFCSSKFLCTVIWLNELV